MAKFSVLMGVDRVVSKYYTFEIEAENADAANEIASKMTEDQVLDGEYHGKAEAEYNNVRIADEAEDADSDPDAPAAPADADEGLEHDDDAHCQTDGCDGRMNDGEGYDGYCGNCADRRENRKTDAEGRPRFSCPNNPEEHTTFYVRAYESHLFNINGDSLISKEPIADSYESDEVGTAKCNGCGVEADDRTPDELLKYA